MLHNDNKWEKLINLYRCNFWGRIPRRCFSWSRYIGMAAEAANWRSLASWWITRKTVHIQRWIGFPRRQLGLLSISWSTVYFCRIYFRKKHFLESTTQLPNEKGFSILICLFKEELLFELGKKKFWSRNWFKFLIYVLSTFKNWFIFWKSFEFEVYWYLHLK